VVGAGASDDQTYYMAARQARQQGEDGYGDSPRTREQVSSAEG